MAGVYLAEYGKRTWLGTVTGFIFPDASRRSVTEITPRAFNRLNKWLALIAWS